MVYSNVNHVEMHHWSLGILTDRAKSLKNFGRQYFDSACTNGFNVGSYILSTLRLPGSLLGKFDQDLHSITSTASFRILKLTVQNIFSSIILFLHGNNPYIRPLCFCLKIVYYVVMLGLLFILPTSIVSLIILGVIYLNFGFGFTVISAGCIASFIIVNLVIRFWVHSQDVGHPSNRKNAETVKNILQSADAGVHNLTNYIDSKIEGTETDPQSTSLLKRAISWHLDLFNFYDRIFQPLTEIRPDVIPQIPKAG